jgi:hypothetical protein
MQPHGLRSNQDLPTSRPADPTYESRIQDQYMNDRHLVNTFLHLANILNPGSKLDIQGNYDQDLIFVKSFLLQCR